MTKDEIQNMPHTSGLIQKEEFAAWIATRQDAGASIDIGTAELKGWWCFEGDPYELRLWSPAEAHPNHDDLPKHSPHYFVRDAASRGWVWQGDLPDDKRAAMQARIDEHNRKVKEFYASRQAAGRLIDIDTCEELCTWTDDTDPYGIELAPYGQISKNSFVRNRDGGDWIGLYDLPAEKRNGLDQRAERERLARKNIIDGLFDVLRRDGDIFERHAAIAAAEKVHGERAVKDVLCDYDDPLMGAIGGLMMQRGYLTDKHIGELLRSDHRQTDSLVTV